MFSNRLYWMYSDKAIYISTTSDGLSIIFLIIKMYVLKIFFYKRCFSREMYPFRVQLHFLKFCLIKLHIQREDTTTIRNSCYYLIKSDTHS